MIFPSFQTIASKTLDIYRLPIQGIELITLKMNSKVALLDAFFLKIRDFYLQNG